MLARTVLALIVFTAAFAVIERVSPVIGTRRSWRASGTDLAWLFVDEGVRLLARLVTVGIVAGVALLAGRELTRAELVGFGPLGGAPTWVQAVLAIAIVDGAGYLVHRLTHAVPWLWRIHAVHHSPRHLDWLAGARVHPLDTLITRPIRTLPALLLGLDPAAVAVTAPFFAFWNLFVHADVSWGLGPLRYVVSTPAFHRWHHADVVGSRNFAPLLPLWDLLGGTFDVPEGPPVATGAAGEDVPEDLVGQVAYPFRR